MSKKPKNITVKFVWDVQENMYKCIGEFPARYYQYSEKYNTIITHYSRGSVDQMAKQGLDSRKSLNEYRKNKSNTLWKRLIKFIKE